MVQFAVLFGVVATLFGGTAVAWGYSRRRYHDVITETPATDVADVDESGLAQFEGEVRPARDGGERTVAAPFSEEECAVVGWHVMDFDESGNTQSWTLVAEGYASAPFELDDGTGAIRVDLGAGTSDTTAGSGGRFANSVVVGETDVDLGRFVPRYTLEPGEERPDAIRAFERETPGVHRQTGSVTNAVDVGHAHGERKFEEATVEHGDTVSVLGRVTPADGDGTGSGLEPDEAVVEPVEGDPFILSTRSRERLTDRTRWGTPAMVAGGGLLLWGLVSLSTAVPGA